MTKIFEFGLATLDAVSALGHADRWMQALVVLYSGIDTLAWATKNAGDVTRNDFYQWTGTYMEPDKRLGCTPPDLYAARCAVVHSGASESRMSREGDATELWYVTAAPRLPELQAFVARKGLNVKVVCTTDLIAAFAAGVLKFSDELDADPERQKQVAARIGRWLGFIPGAQVTGAE